MGVRTVKDQYLAVDAEIGDGSGFGVPPIELRPGSDEGKVRLVFEPGTAGREIEIFDLRRGLKAVEDEEWGR